MLIDIAFNGASEDFSKNLEEIMMRAKNANVLPLIVGLDINTSKKAIEIAEKFNTMCYVGIHPLHMVPYDDEIKNLIKHPRVIAVGELGLDYFRASNKNEQKELFKKQLRISNSMPLFLHCRESFDDFINILLEETKNKQEVNDDFQIKGVVHSFDGTIEQANKLINIGLYIGLNGCSLRSKESIEVVKQLPLERILLETDSPYCLIRKSYAASEYVDIIKARNNEPSFLRNVCEAIAKIKNIETEELEVAVFENTLRLFPQLRTILEP